MLVSFQYKGIRLYSDVYVRNKVKEESDPYTNEYAAQQQQQGTGTGTGMNDEQTPAARHVYRYHPVFLSSFSSAVCAMSMPTPPSPALYMPPVLAPPT